MRRLQLLLIVALIAAGLTACHPSSNVARCDNVIAGQEETIASMGGWLRCDPSYDPDEQSHCPPTFRCTIVVQWNKYVDGVRQPWPWIWEKNQPDDHWLNVYAFELVCQVYDYRAGLIPSYYLDVQQDAVPASVEQSCFSWAVAQAA